MTIIAVGSNHVCSAITGLVCGVHVFASSLIMPFDCRRRLQPPGRGKDGVKTRESADRARDVLHLANMPERKDTLVNLSIKNRSCAPGATRGLCLLAAAAIAVGAFVTVDLQEAHADSLDAYDAAYAGCQTAGKKLKVAVEKADKTLDAYPAGSLYAPGLHSRLEKQRDQARETGKCIAHDASSLSSSEASEASEDLSKLARRWTKLAGEMDSTTVSIRRSAEEKLDVDARGSLKKTIADARTTLASADGDYSGVVPQDQRDKLQKAVDEAEDAVSKTVKHDEAKAKADAIKAAKATVDKTISDYDAALAEQSQQAAAASAWSGSYDGSSQASTAYQSGSGYAYSPAYSYGPNGNGQGGYYTATSCGGNIAECQSNIDGNARGALNVMVTDVAGTKYYQAHTSSWGASSVNINGQDHALGAWQQAQYINGQPYGPNDGKSYYQTCGPDGKVYYAPMN